MFAILQSKTKYYALQSTVIFINGKIIYLKGKYFIQTEEEIKSYRQVSLSLIIIGLGAAGAQVISEIIGLDDWRNTATII